jgi:hypothetical protein
MTFDGLITLVTNATITGICFSFGAWLVSRNFIRHIEKLEGRNKVEDKKNTDKIN